MNAIWCRDQVWRAFGSSGQDLRRYNAVLGEFAKARLRARLHDRLGIRFERDPETRESEAVGIPLKLREAWSKRSKAIRAKAGPGASAARRRVVAMQLAQLERKRAGQRVWDPVVLLDLWRTEARAVAGDVDQAVAVAAPGPPPRTRTADPTVDEILSRLWLVPGRPSPMVNPGAAPCVMTAYRPGPGCPRLFRPSRPPVASPESFRPGIRSGQRHFQGPFQPPFRAHFRPLAGSWERRCRSPVTAAPHPIHTS